MFALTTAVGRYNHGFTCPAGNAASRRDYGVAFESKHRLEKSNLDNPRQAKSLCCCNHSGKLFNLPARVFTWSASLTASAAGPSLHQPTQSTLAPQ